MIIIILIRPVQMNFLNAFLKCESINASYLKYTLPLKNYYLIKWFPSSRTDIHGHNGKECKFLLLNGSLIEYRYNNNSRKINNLKPLKLYTINDQIGTHLMKNHEDKIKWSIHKYY